MKRSFLLSVTLAAVLVSTLAATAATLYVAPAGQTGAAGTATAPYASLVEAVTKAQPGDTIRVAGGTYRLSQTVHLTGSGTAEAPIRIEPVDADLPVFDFSEQAFGRDAFGLDVKGDHWQIVGLTVIKAGRFGFNVTGHHNVIEHCIAHDNQGTGFEIGAPGSHNLVQDCNSYRNVDRPTRGQNADGFAAKFNIGEGNIFRGCRAWENADDGFDLWKAPFPVRLEYCVAYRNGLNLWAIEGFTGNGNGFKLGGDFVPAAHVVIGCVAFDQPKHGFDQNNNTAALVLAGCTAAHCQFGFSLTLATTDGRSHVLKDNTGWDAPAVLVEGTVQERNHWANGMRAQVGALIVKSTPVTKSEPVLKKASPK